MAMTLSFIKASEVLERLSNIDEFKVTDESKMNDGIIIGKLQDDINVTCTIMDNGSIVLIPDEVRFNINDICLYKSKNKEKEYRITEYLDTVELPYFKGKLKAHRYKLYNESKDKYIQGNDVFYYDKYLEGLELKNNTDNDNIPNITQEENSDVKQE